MARCSRLATLALALACAGALACGRSKAIGGGDDGGTDAPPTPDAAPDRDAPPSDAAGAADASDAAEVAPHVFLPAPPVVDCTPYAGLASCVLHVSRDGAARHNGLTWATALADVQDALDRSTCGCEVWIAGSTYRPARGPDHDPPDPRDRSFMVWPGLRVLGGFEGDEPTADARGPVEHETILSGDLGVPGDVADNAYHVVVAGEGSLLDGFTIRDGKANGFDFGQGVGAGLFVVSAAVELRNVKVTDNAADTGGGIWADRAAALTLDGCTVARNVADVGGGIATNALNTLVVRSTFFENVGVFVGGAIAHQGRMMTVRDSTFVRNRGDFGAAVALSEGDTLIERTWFEGNMAGLFGGALFLRFGSHARVSSSVMTANASVGHGGAVTVWTGSADLEGLTIVGNHATFGGAFVVKDGAHLAISDSVVWRNPDDVGKTLFLEGDGNTVEISTSNVPAELPGKATFDADPLLGNVPLDTRYTDAKGVSAEFLVAMPEKHFTVGDRVEVGDDGVERKVTAVSARGIEVAPALAAPPPRFLRIDRWAAAAPGLVLDLVPRAGSPLVDAASGKAPALDVRGGTRVGAADIGAIERRP